MRYFVILLTLLIGTFSVRAQVSHSERVSGEILLQLVPNGDIKNTAEQLTFVNGKNTGIEVLSELSDIMRIWHIRFDPSLVSEEEMLLAVRLNKNIREAQFNHYVELRSTVPNDPAYAQQWQYDNNGTNGGVADADLDMPDAWDITTGGLTADGDTIVVAVIDDGVNLNHPDLQGNLWVNHGEIPGNGIDDDGNGYVDDYYGWNPSTNNGNVSGGSHGTPVAGIIGAKGNNGIGVAGINWDIKLMIIKGSSQTESVVISAYGYALKMRKLYNQTNGAQGAFVVATNSSFGVNNGKPANYPLWCAMYDSLGAAGILSAGATANSNVNVDVVGDMPTACGSDYLISVTNVGRNDVKVGQAGYGATTIDIGSFGESTYTLTSSAYGSFAGTSGATPHVAGTVALMYAAPCPEFIQLAKSAPHEAAEMVKEWILESGEVNASLAGITVTGKRLNTFNALSELMNNCGACPLPGGVGTSNHMLYGVDVSWNVSLAATDYLVQYRKMGDSAWTEVYSASSPVSISGLDTCTSYEYRIRSICDTVTANGFTNIFTFRTDGCCEAPSFSSVSNLAETEALVSWEEVTIAQGYDFRVRKSGTSIWTDYNGIPDSEMNLSDLAPCEIYEYQIAAICSTETTPYGDLYTFKTRGCGACEEYTYCSVGGDSYMGYIDKVELGILSNISGDNGGYGNFISGTAPLLRQDSSSNIILTPDVQTFPVTKQWRIWIDWNQNGIFEASELAYTASGTAPSSGVIAVPATADTGITRMRVSMGVFGVLGECSQDEAFGEVEDYCVRVLPKVSGVGMKNNTADKNTLVIYPNPVSHTINIAFNGTSYETVALLDISGKTLATYNIGKALDVLQLDVLGYAEGVYLVRLIGKSGNVTKKIIVRR